MKDDREGARLYKLAADQGNDFARSALKTIGSADLGGQIETTKKELYVQSKDFYPAQQDAYLNYLFCSIISADNTLNTLQKLDALAKIRTPRPQSSNEPPIHDPPPPPGRTSAMRVAACAEHRYRGAPSVFAILRGLKGPVWSGPRPIVHLLQLFGCK
jgi:hypothetical protein